jgi:hypothetical protein
MIASPGEVSNSGVIAGGQGGYSTYLGSGGRGGDAIDITQTGVVHNSGTIDGGRGGMSYEYGSGGGTGVNLFGGMLTNQGTISGGQGGHHSYYGTDGVGHHVLSETVWGAGQAVSHCHPNQQRGGGFFLFSRVTHCFVIGPFSCD